MIKSETDAITMDRQITHQVNRNRGDGQTMDRWNNRHIARRTERKTDSAQISGWISEWTGDKIQVWMD